MEGGTKSKDAVLPDRYAQVVIGPPGSGKSTYCNGMQQFLSALGRKVVVINLDPANDNLPYDCAVNIADLCSVSKVMDEHKLGPNGATIYCMEYLEKNVDWLEKRLLKIPIDSYVLFDCPGQVELVTHHESFRNILEILKRRTSFQLVSVHLIDASYCTDSAKFISAVMLSLNVMLRIELPHVNVLSKLDLLEKSGQLPFDLEFYTGVTDLPRLLSSVRDSAPKSPAVSSPRASSSSDSLSHRRPRKIDKTFKALNDAFCDIVDGFNLVSFVALHIEDKRCMAHVAQQVDLAVSYRGPGSRELADLRIDHTEWIRELQERYVTKRRPADGEENEIPYCKISERQWKEITAPRKR